MVVGSIDFAIYDYRLCVSGHVMVIVLIITL